jgi:hypothetical protein
MTGNRLLPAAIAALALAGAAHAQETDSDVAMNGRGIATARGGKWEPTVRNVLKRASP